LDPHEIDKLPGTHGKVHRSVPASIWVSTLYFCEGLPFSIVRLMSSVYFKDLGVPNRLIGLFSSVGLAWSIKLIWSPLVDLVSTRRRWLLITQGLLVISGLVLALTPGLSFKVEAAMIAMAAMALLSATQDIAIDGYYLEALNEKDQAEYAGMRVAAYRVAMIVGSGALVALAGLTGWTAGFGAAAVIMGLLLFFHALFLPVLEKKQGKGRERNGKDNPEQNRDATCKAQALSLSTFMEAFTSYLHQPRIILVLLFIMLYKQGDALLFAMNTPFFMDIGVTVPQLGLIAGTIGKIASIGGSIAGGMLMARLGVKKGVWILSFAMNVPIAMYIWLAHEAAKGQHVSLLLVGTVHSLEQLAAGLGTAAYMVFLMRTCSKKYKAAHYAIATSLMALGMTGAGMVSGYLTEALGYEEFFWVCFAATLPGLLMMWFLPFGRFAADMENHARAGKP